MGAEQIRHPWPFLGFWIGLVFDLNILLSISRCMWCLHTCFAKKKSHSSPHMLKMTKLNYLQILLHPPVPILLHTEAYQSNICTC